MTTGRRQLPARAKLFRNGRSQAVRLPREFRFKGSEVSVRREGGAVILEPVGRESWPRGYWERLAEASPSFDVERMAPRLEVLEVDDR